MPRAGERKNSVEELTDNHDEASQNTPSPAQPHCCRYVPRCCTLRWVISRDTEWLCDGLPTICRMAFSGSPTMNAGMWWLWDEFELWWGWWGEGPWCGSCPGQNYLWGQTWPRKRQISSLYQTQRQEVFWQAHLSQEVNFKRGQLQKCHNFEASLVVKEARFRTEVTQRRLAQQAKIEEESQGNLDQPCL